MTYAKSLLRPSFSLLCAASLLGGCIITSSDDSDSTDSGDDGDDGVGPGATGNPDDGVDDGVDDSVDETGDEGSGDGTIPPPCGTNLLADPGFEEGTPSTAWMESSLVFPSPICDAGCTEDPGAAPFEGDWWVWFGGVEEPEMASVAQTINLTGDTAELQFALSINAAAGMGNDLVQVHIDDTEVFMASDAEMADFDGYTAVTIDISDFADGEDHLLIFSGDLDGQGLTNFFIDNASVSACDDSGTGGSDTGDSGTGDTAADETTAGDTGSGSGSDTGSSTGGSSDGGSSSSDGGSSSSTAG